ncbi:MAG: DEAD/DEAH box helicase family protein, partial [Bacteroidota bacterium]|nr:DEAD/DEAH box helicase family protein [Bacteroidota bacterium]
MSTNAFYEHPILNSPYEYPRRHWELDKDGQPTQKLLETRRPADFVTPIPQPKKTKGKTAKETQEDLLFGEVKEISTEDQKYLLAETINTMRRLVERWRTLPEQDWGVTPETARLLRHWRHHAFNSYRPFFCQIEAVETIIWLTEVAPSSKAGKEMLAHLEAANAGANPGLSRLALKLATGAGKTTVMAMIIAWQTINAVRRPGSRHFTRGFLVVAPGLTIRDRLRVLLPNDPDNYYATRELVPSDMREEMQRAKIVITNFHAFKPRER